MNRKGKLLNSIWKLLDFTIESFHRCCYNLTSDFLIDVTIVTSIAKDMICEENSCTSQGIWFYFHTIYYDLKGATSQNDAIMSL